MFNLDDYNFDISEDFIGKPNKKESKLLVLNKNNGNIKHFMFNDILDFLEKGDSLVFNKSKVRPSRINFFYKKQKREIVLLEVLDFNKNIYKALVYPGRRLKENKKIKIDNEDVEIIVLKENEDGTRNIQIIADNLSDFLENFAEISNPPYIKKTDFDSSKYQNVYAKDGFSVACPTAGLHFTKDLIEKIKQKGVNIVFVNLDVSAGTFVPVKTEDIRKHQIHQENFSLGKKEAEILNKTKKKGKKIIAVGTTSLRVLETVFLKKAKFQKLSGRTDLFLYPTCKIKSIDALLTNFHTPKSTLLMLVSAFSSRDFIKKAYEEAKEKKYKFFSFGDAMLIL
jgi:S-adenosylmethionine:tRNA ribosyltransferase-isomerase